MKEKSLKHNEDKQSRNGKELNGNDPKFNNSAHLKKNLSTSTPSFSVMPVTIFLIMLRIIIRLYYSVYRNITQSVVIYQFLFQNSDESTLSRGQSYNSLNKSNLLQVDSKNKIKVDSKFDNLSTDDRENEQRKRKYSLGETFTVQKFVSQ